MLVQFDGGACDAGCERKLYFMRQVRRAQGKEMPRVARLWLVTDKVAAARGTSGRHRGDRGRARSRPAWISRPSGPLSDHIYLVDPLGNLMMRFPRDPDPSRVIKDLQRLLRASSFGG